MSKIRLYTESASNDHERSLGLMHRDQLGYNSGMVFVFASPRRMSFWMKDTKIPLDIAFVNEDMVISEISPMNPYSLKSVVSKDEVLYAVEANYGFFDRNGIVPGSKVIVAQSKINEDEDLNQNKNETVKNQPIPNEEVKPPATATPTPTATPQPQKQEVRNPMPDLVLNMSVFDVIPIANKYKLSIAFDYQLPNGNIESYYLIPKEKYQVHPGRAGRLVCGPCSHSFGEFRNFKIDNIIGYDLYETEGPRKGRMITLPVSNPPGKNFNDISSMPTTSKSRVGMLKEAEYNTSQYMMTEYWDEIAKKRSEGKTEGEAILEYLEENSKKSSKK